MDALIINHERMQSLIDSLGEGLCDVIEAYLDNTPNQIDQMREALDRAEFDELSRIAHSMKSSSGIFGAQEMVALSRELEHRDCADLPGCREKVEQLAVSFVKLRDVLNLYLAEINRQAENGIL